MEVLSLFFFKRKTVDFFKKKTIYNNMSQTKKIRLWKLSQKE